MSSSLYINDKVKDILIVGEGPTQPNRRIVLSLHYNGSNSFLFVSYSKIYQFKAKDSEIKDCTLCLGNISKDFTINNMKRKGLKGVINCFSVDFNTIDNNRSLDIHKYLMKRT